MKTRISTLRLILAGTAAIAVATVPLVPASAHGVASESFAAVAEKATIKGKVVDADGKPAAKIGIELFEVNVGGQSGGPAPADLAAQNAKYGKAIAKAVTDENGVFEIKKPLDAGKNFRIVAGNKAVGMGFGNLTAKEGVNEVELKLNKAVKSTGGQAPQ